jgi:hypothetical protein
LVILQTRDEKIMADKSRIRGFLTPKQRQYVETGGAHCDADERRQWDYRIRESAKKALEDLAFLAKKLPEDQQIEVFTVERVISSVGAMLSFKAQKADPFQVMWEQRRRFHIAAQLRALATKIVEEFNKLFLGEEGIAITPFITQWYEDSVVFSLGKEPFGEGIAPIALFKPGEPIKYARAARTFKAGDAIPKNGLEFVPWEEIGEKRPEPIQMLRYRKAPGAPKMFTGDKVKVVWCTKYAERLFLGTCEKCLYGNVEKCDFREPVGMTPTAP